MHFQGVIPAVTTPFAPDGALDLDALRRNAGRLLDAGMAGFVGNGTMGEAGSLSLSERREVLDRPELAAAATEIVPRRDWRLWTDDFNNLVQVLKK